MNFEDALKKLGAELDALKKSKAHGRLGKLFDDGNYTELDRFSKNGSEQSEVVTAYGTIGGTPAYAFSQDVSVLSGAMGRVQAAKIKRVYQLAAENGMPVVGIFDSNGAHVDEGMDALAAYSELIALSSKLSGVVPQISVIVGACIGSAAVLASLADVVVMSKEAEFYVMSGKIVGDKNGVVGSAELASKNGAAQIVAEDDDAAVTAAVSLLSYLPSNNLSVSPFADYISAAPVSDGVLGTVAGVVDGESFLELSSKFSSSAKVGLARVAGNAVGVVATDSSVNDGKIDADGAVKIARFVRMCDAFSVPVVTLLDSNGFMGTKEAELSGDVKSVALLTQAYTEATTPKVTVIVGNAIGAAFIAMAGRASGADAVYAWPSAVIGALEPITAVELLYKERLAAGEDRAALEAEYAEKECSPFVAATGGYIDDIIAPSDTSVKLITALEMLSGKRVNTLSKKHSNMPL